MSNGELRTPSKLLVNYVEFLGGIFSKHFKYDTVNILEILKQVVEQERSSFSTIAKTDVSIRRKIEDIFFRCRLRARVNSFNENRNANSFSKRQDEKDKIQIKRHIRKISVFLTINIPFSPTL